MLRDRQTLYPPNDALNIHLQVYNKEKLAFTLPEQSVEPTRVSVSGLQQEMPPILT